MSELAHLSATVYGHVQGVFYRAFVSRTAKAMNLKGYVHNLPRSDAVEIHVEGPKNQLEDFLIRLEGGPPEAVVERVEPNWLQYTGQFFNFDVRY